MTYDATESKSRCVEPNRPSESIDQSRPRTLQSALDADNRGEEKIDFACLDLLEAAQVQVG